jgi:hypothetical protein
MMSTLPDGPSGGRAGPGRPLLVADEAAADDQALDLARSLIQPKQPDLAVDPLDRCATDSSRACHGNTPDDTGKTVTADSRG